MALLETQKALKETFKDLTKLSGKELDNLYNELACYMAELNHEAYARAYAK